MKYISLFIIVFLFAENMNAQQVPLNNFYQQNPFVINPAAAGLQGNVSAFLNYRDQWSGLKGAPEITSFGIHGLISNSMGLGLNIEQNNTGIFKEISVDLNYSYRVAISNEQSVAFGLMFGLSQNKLNYEEMQVSSETDPILFSSNLLDESLIKSGFGIHYNWKSLNLHVSTPLFYGMQEKSYLQTLFSFVSYDFQLKDGIWEIQPSILYRYTVSSKEQLDINLIVKWEQKLWTMTSYRTNKNIIVGFGVFIKNLGIGYTYEINRSELSSVAAGSHELMIRFESPISITKKKAFYKSSKRRASWN